MTRDRRTITLNDIDDWGEEHAPILINAIRLFDDAQALRKTRRYASATALSVLCIEEAGKFVLNHHFFARLVERPELKRGISRFSHKQKQVAAAQMVMGVLGFHQIGELLKLAGFRPALVPIESDDLDKDDQEDGRTAFGELVRVFSVLKDDKLEELASQAELEGHLVFFVQLLKGKYDDLKQQCFYVDLAADGKVIRDPTRVDRKTCDGALKIASKALWAIKTNLRRYWRFHLSNQVS